MTSSEIGSHLLKTRQSTLRELAANYVQLLTMETQSIDLLVAAMPQHIGNSPSSLSAKKEAIKAEDGLTNAIRASAVHEARTVDSFSASAKSERTAENIRARFQNMMKSFEGQPSSDTKMTEMRAKAEDIFRSLHINADTSGLEAVVTKFATDPLVTYLDSKQLEGRRLGAVDRIIARWVGYDAYIGLSKQIEELRLVHSDVCRKRRDRLTELQDIMAARTTAFRREARERIAAELNVAMIDVEKFDRHDEARQLSVTELYKTIDLFQPAYFNRAVRLLGLSEGSVEAKTATAFLDQLTAMSAASRETAVSLRDRYRKITELFRAIRQYFPSDHTYRFENLVELDEWISDETKNADDILERMIDRVPGGKEAVRLRAS